MKEYRHKEDTENPVYSFFEATEHGPLEPVAAGSSAIVEPVNDFLTNFLTAVKWAFLYVPGAAVIHLMMMGLALMVFYGDWQLELFTGSFGIATVAAFMIMLGIGKWADLKYLRVVAGVAAVSALVAVCYMIAATFIPGDFFGTMFKATLPLPLIAGYLFKKNTDRIDDETH